ncbi:Gfo/Idh/MocA family oxidoreductase [Devosia sp. 63-57]|uniref:Gfo/Idh/MocA family oxidoreductase n=1 Tax=Devosia sp. 63-57 TaxID=1895751 RepID=UPI00086B08BC|nr:Gfo/Idh/MocA family oxidoreductase [Devosia sp. 63-57]ODT48977.1 MAG: dehydrogenase [Pelagibacterium sp. SCN 63-126]ODU89370.1 MAG: dehydrogenase [Pelagibacterium sp. SCN 63-17]OJX44092.1 MAG: dehydrogenase [Devosia sp. 63-57]
MTKTYALVGTGGRARMFYEAILGPHRDQSRLVALCDTNAARMDFTNRVISGELGGTAVPTYRAADFATMIAETRPDVVIVTSIDRTHHQYIIAAMELGCDVITEKPMTTDPEKCQAILDAVARTGRDLRVTFNYRYAPHNSALRELIAEGAIGKVTSVHFEWLLDTRHGADYFRRWHRDKRNSGGLMVHKSTHHFDLVNFWLGSQPDTVFGMGDLKFYGRANAEERGVFTPYTRTTGVAAAKDDPFAIDLTDNPVQKGLYWDAEAEDGYQRDQNVFGDGISIEDTMNVIVRYRNKAVMTYSLYAYAPWEGFNVAINGTGGRLELTVHENSYINAGAGSETEGAAKGVKLYHFPLHGEPRVVPVKHGEGGHGGGDKIMLEEIFGDATPRPGYGANHRDGALSILTGIAANKSFATGMPVDVNTLVRF